VVRLSLGTRHTILTTAEQSSGEPLSKVEEAVSKLLEEADAIG
jgi:hypothetical protein